MLLQHSQTVSIFLLSWLISGCSGPVITLRHHLAGAVDMGVEPGTLQVGQFQVRPDTYADLPAHLQNNLRQRLADFNHPASVSTAQTAPSPGPTVEGVIIVIAEDSAGSRPIQQWSSRHQKLEDAEVPSLRRDVTAKVNFVLRQSAAESGDVTLETYHSYSTNQDPLIRGEGGLLAPDDPERVPPVDVIARQLVDECLGDFIAMIHPYEIVAKMPLRRVGGTDAANGLRAAQQGDYAAAARYYQAALRAKPDSPPLHFNLAVVGEAGGDLAAAEEHYRQALEQQPPDELARTGLERVARLRRIHAYERELPPL
jgi:hypothetical protein